MRLQPAAALLSGLLLLGTSQAGAIPFCERFPEAPICNPQDDPPLDPCELDPESCEPDPEDPEAEPEPSFTHSANLDGPARLKGEGINLRDGFPVTLHFDADTFSAAIPQLTTPLLGTLSPKGAKGNKLQLFLDDASSEAYADYLARAATGAMGTPNVLGQSTVVILKFRADGSAALNIKTSLLIEGFGEVVFKARLIGSVRTRG